MSEGQLFVVGLVASLILEVLKAIYKMGWKPSKEVIAIGLYIVSLVIAAVFSGAGLPSFSAFSDAPTFVSALLEFIGQLLAMAAPIVGLAYLIYNVILKRVIDGLPNLMKRLTQQ